MKTLHVKRETKAVVPPHRPRSTGNSGLPSVLR
jgi:hypothetical protein